MSKFNPWPDAGPVDVTLIPDDGLVLGFAATAEATEDAGLGTDAICVGKTPPTAPSEST